MVNGHQHIVKVELPREQPAHIMGEDASQNSSQNVVESASSASHVGGASTPHGGGTAVSAARAETENISRWRREMWQEAMWRDLTMEVPAPVKLGLKWESRPR